LLTTDILAIEIINSKYAHIPVVSLPCLWHYTTITLDFTKPLAIVYYPKL